MNRQQYLLTKLAEEASEVAQIALKAQQFGLDYLHPKLLESNAARIRAELTDLLAIVDMLNEECLLSFLVHNDAIATKKEKVNKYYQYSIQLGEVHQ